tara:strand:- start:183 stop:287 length:105 start_codon:yes stop_codon:yes gene_type:complete
MKPIVKPIARQPKPKKDKIKDKVKRNSFSQIIWI